ncbi:MAG: hypothetical protein ABFS16_12185 [Bacteroidota bacterium]
MKLSILAVFLIIAVTLSAKENEETLVWPREIQVKKYVITLYQPQLESLTGNNLEGRMALSVKKDKEDLIFGALWFNAKILTDMEERTAVLENLEIPKVKFPDIEDESKLETLKEVVIEDLESVNFEMSLDRILADLEEVESAALLSDRLNNTPPKIYYRSTPTVLVLVDGEPVMKEVENSKMEYVMNSPFLIVKHKSYYFLKGGNYWYTSKEIVTEDWKVTKSVPKDVKKLAEQMVENQEEPENDGDNEIPDIIVTSVPSELIVSNGKLEYESISGTSLLFAKNSENDILMDINSQHHFVLLNGRWFSSKTLKDGDWQFIEPTDLPADFAKIPTEATIASVRSSVPGTEEAQEAKYEQQMPQTAVVDRKTAIVEVEYDGDPKFEKIDGSSVEYAINTASTVLRINSTFYCVDDGIWFESKNAKGPWAVSDSRPKEVDEIPPSAPVYNVKYVYIYDSTPDVVYVGYTPGYCHSYWYNGVVFYGTGYYYHPWYGHYYYPRPWTFGFGVHYNPYTGWGFSVGLSYGWFHMGFYGSGHGYWGPAGYRHGYRHGYHHGYHHGYRDGYLKGYAAGYANGKYNSRNIYKRRNSGIRSTQNVRRNPAVANNRPGDRKVSTRPSTKPNNVFADRDGNIHSRDKSGNWTQKNKRPSKRPDLPNKSAQRPSTRPTKPATRPSSRPQQLERDYNNRSRGTTRYNNYQYNRSAPATRSRSMPSRSAPSRGGGRMRR